MKNIVLYVKEKWPCHQNDFWIIVSIYVRIYVEAYVYVLHVYMLVICIYFNLNFSAEDCAILCLYYYKA